MNQLTLADLPKPEEIPGLFRRFNCEPACRFFERRSDAGVHCCVIGILARVFEIPHDVREGYRLNFEARGINHAQYWAIAHGWDDVTDFYQHRPAVKPWNDYGRACADAVFPKEPEAV